MKILIACRNQLATLLCDIHMVIERLLALAQAERQLKPPAEGLTWPFPGGKLVDNRARAAD